MVPTSNEKEQKFYSVYYCFKISSCAWTLEEIKWKVIRFNIIYKNNSKENNKLSFRPWTTKFFRFLFWKNVEILIFLFYLYSRLTHLNIFNHFVWEHSFVLMHENFLLDILSLAGTRIDCLESSCKSLSTIQWN